MSYHYVSSNKKEAERVNKYAHHVQLAPKLWHQGKKRESIDEYLLAFQHAPSPTDKLRWQMFVEYSAQFEQPRESKDYVEPTSDDIETLRKMMKDKSEFRLFRMAAANTMGNIKMGDATTGNREAAVDLYHQGLEFFEKKLTKHQIKMEQTTKMYDGQDTLVTMAFLVEEQRKRLNYEYKKNTVGISGLSKDELPPQQFTLDGTPLPFFKQGLEPCDYLWEALEYDMVACRRMTVLSGGGDCDCCGKVEDKGIDHDGDDGKCTKLLQCGRCLKAYYCSVECQKRQWKCHGHREHCRKPGVIKVGDFVALTGLVNKPELNDRIGKVIAPVKGKDDGTPARWQIKFSPKTKENYSISVKNIKQLRPFDSCKRAESSKDSSLSVSEKAIKAQADLMAEYRELKGKSMTSKGTLAAVEKEKLKYIEDSMVKLEERFSYFPSLVLGKIIGDVVWMKPKTQDGVDVGYDGLVVTGIATYFGKERRCIKLHELNIPEHQSSGHLMNEEELLSECAHYFTDHVEPERPFGNPKLLKKKLLKSFKNSYHTGRSGLKPIGNLLYDYSDKPRYVFNDNRMRKEVFRLTGRTNCSMTGEDLVRYPFHDRSLVQPPFDSCPPALVRAGDMCYVVADKDDRRKERFHIKAVSVTVSGIVTGTVENNLQNYNLKCGDWVYFHVWNVLDVTHGKNWSKDNEKEKQWKQRANSGWDFLNPGLDDPPNWVPPW